MEELVRIHLSKLHLSLKTLMLSKLDESAPWHYLHCPEDMDKTSFKARLQKFIEEDLEAFISECIKVLPTLQEKDILSLGGEMMPQAKAFLSLYEYLQNKGIPGTKAFDKEQIFWSGTEARHKALVGDYLCDSKVPAIAMLFDLCTTLMKAFGGYNDYIRLLSGATSKLYCLGATGVAHVYLNSDKTSESAGITTPNNFWLDELPTLRKLMWQGQVSDIHVHLYDHTSGLWLAPKKLSHGDLDDLVIRRRSAYTPKKAEDFRKDLHEDKSDIRFKRNNLSSEEVAAWRSSAPRPAITFGRLHALALHWYEHSKHKEPSVAL